MTQEIKYIIVESLDKLMELIRSEKSLFVKDRMVSCAFMQNWSIRKLFYLIKEGQIYQKQDIEI